MFQDICSDVDSRKSRFDWLSSHVLIRTFDRLLNFPAKCKTTSVHVSIHLKVFSKLMKLLITINNEKKN